MKLYICSLWPQDLHGNFSILTTTFNGPTIDSNLMSAHTTIMTDAFHSRSGPHRTRWSCNKMRSCEAYVSVLNTRNCRSNPWGMVYEYNYCRTCTTIVQLYTLQIVQHCAVFVCIIQHTRIVPYWTYRMR